MTVYIEIQKKMKINYSICKTDRYIITIKKRHFYRATIIN